jgi:type VI secretion system secreted protein Hcp
MAAVDYFLKIDGIKGESTDDKHKGEIDLESWSWGAMQTGTASHGGGAGAGKVSKEDFRFVKKTDKSSPNLMIACATGQHFKEALLTARKAGGGQQEFLTVKLSDLIVSSYNTEGAGHSDAIPMEHIGLNFTKLEMVYKEQKPDGTLGADVKQTYDFGANKKL